MNLPVGHSAGEESRPRYLPILNILDVSVPPAT